MTLPNNKLQDRNLPTQPNYTQIPNVFFDYWMNILSPSEFKVLMVIARKTFGWQKKIDAISRCQICKMSGLSKEGTRKAIYKLQEYNLIVKHEQISEYGDNESNLYEINIVESCGTQDFLPEGGNTVAYPPTTQLPTPPPLSCPTKESIQNKDQQKIVCSEAGGKPPPGPEGPSSHLEFPSKIKKIINNKEIEIRLEQIFYYSVMTNQNWTTEEIQTAWQILCDYEGQLYDHHRFIEGTIKNLRNKKKAQVINNKGVKKCNTQKNKSRKSEEKASENSMNEPPSPPYKGSLMDYLREHGIGSPPPEGPSS